MSLYFDYNSTYPVPPDFLARVMQDMTDLGNPSSVHAYGRRARLLIEDARFKVAACVKCQAEQIIFTSGGTEANNMVLNNAHEIMSPEGLVMVSAIEHPSVLKTASKIFGDRLVLVPVSAQGVIDLDFIQDKLKNSEGKAFISAMYANNETGVIQPIADVVKIARRYDTLVHCDAAQAFGKIPVDFKALEVDFLTLSGHKCGALPGVGALVMRKDLRAFPFVMGGGQEKGRRAGTENIMGIHSWGVKLENFETQLQKMEKCAELRDLMEKKMQAFDPDLLIMGQEVTRLPNTSMVVTPSIKGDVLVISLDLDGIAVSAGSACSSGKMAASPVLQAMGLSEAEAMGGLRISLGPTTTELDVRRFLEAWKKNMMRKKETSCSLAKGHLSLRGTK